MIRLISFYDTQNRVYEANFVPTKHFNGNTKMKKKNEIKKDLIKLISQLIEEEWEIVEEVKVVK